MAESTYPFAGPDLDGPLSELAQHAPRLNDQARAMHLASADQAAKNADSMLTAAKFVAQKSRMGSVYLWIVVAWEIAWGIMILPFYTPIHVSIPGWNLGVLPSAFQHEGWVMALMALPVVFIGKVFRLWRESADAAKQLKAATSTAEEATRTL